MKELIILFVEVVPTLEVPPLDDGKIEPIGLRAERLTRDCDGGPVTEVLGLGARQGLQITRMLERLARGADGGGQHLLREPRSVRLIDHPAIIATGGV